MDRPAQQIHPSPLTEQGDRHLVVDGDATEFQVQIARVIYIMGVRGQAEHGLLGIGERFSFVSRARF